MRVRIVAARSLGDSVRGKFPFESESKLLLEDAEIEVVKAAGETLRGVGESAKPVLPHLVEAWRRLSAEVEKFAATFTASQVPRTMPEDAHRIVVTIDVIDSARAAIEPDVSHGFAEAFAENLKHWKAVSKFNAWGGVSTIDEAAFENEIYNLARRFGRSERKTKRISGAILGEVLKIISMNDPELTDAAILFLDILTEDQKLEFEVVGTQQRADADLLVGELNLLVLSSHKTQVTQRLARILAILQ